MGTPAGSGRRGRPLRHSRISIQAIPVPINPGREIYSRLQLPPKWGAGGRVSNQHDGTTICRNGNLAARALCCWPVRAPAQSSISIAGKAAVEHDGRVALCLGVGGGALSLRKPEIFNTDQGSQFTSLAFTGVLERAGIRISMDGHGRWMDNVFIERLWRSVGQGQDIESFPHLKRWFLEINERPGPRAGWRVGREWLGGGPVVTEDSKAILFGQKAI